ncbi:MAG: helix-turn-helix transcriptional regulator [Lachnospiraceae bacterium]|nr:helix-turn-helix transcriptional regulator [Lachnospiraceae bacterium]
MSHTIGFNIRRLRKAAGMTQEQLACRLNVSFQTVSKWENDLMAPDLSLLPVLAEVFQVSIDELLGYNGKARKTEIQKLSLKAWKYRKEGDLKAAENLLRQGLLQYPGDDTLLNCLLYAVEDRTERMGIATSLCETTADAEVRYDALRFLAEDYATEGNYDMAKAMLDRIPELYFTKLSVAAQILPGEDKKVNAEKQKWISLEGMVIMMAELSRYYQETGEAELAKKERDRAEELITLFQPDMNFADALREKLQVCF